MTAESEKTLSDFTTDELRAELAKRGGIGRPKKIEPCPKCGEPTTGDQRKYKHACGYLWPVGPTRNKPKKRK
jgi:hypothetical protein